MAILSTPCQIERSTAESAITLTVTGCIDERSDLSPLLSVSGANTLVLDLAGVERINSVGVRDWIEAMRQIPADIAVYWERTAVPMVCQLAMIANFHGHSRIRSIMAPYYCNPCDLEHQILLTVDKSLTSPPHTAPPFDCPDCGKTMEFDELEEDYFASVAAVNS